VVLFSSQPRPRVWTSTGVLLPIRSRLKPSHGFDSATIRMMTAVFEDAWREVKKSDLNDGTTEALRDKLAKFIIAKVKAGVRNPVQLRTDALAYLTLAYPDKFD
jgi:hypothetical protein